MEKKTLAATSNFYNIARQSCLTKLPSDRAQITFTDTQLLRGLTAKKGERESREREKVERERE
jgi:hypothetical protein